MPSQCAYRSLFAVAFLGALSACSEPECPAYLRTEANDCVDPRKPDSGAPTRTEEQTTMLDAGSRRGGTSGRSGTNAPESDASAGTTGSGGVGGMTSPADHDASSGSGGSSSTPDAGAKAGAGGVAGTSMTAERGGAGGVGGATGTTTMGGRGGVGGGSGGGGTTASAGQGGGAASGAGPVCGDGKVEGDELCDGNCPSSCPDDGDGCTKTTIEGLPYECNSRCVNTPINPAPNKVADGCCPSGATSDTDGDCPWKLTTTSTTLYDACDTRSSTCNGDSECKNFHSTVSSEGVCAQQCQNAGSMVLGTDGLGRKGICTAGGLFMPICETAADCPATLTSCRVVSNQATGSKYKFCGQD